MLMVQRNTGPRHGCQKGEGEVWGRGEHEKYTVAWPSQACPSTSRGAVWAITPQARA